MKKTLLLLLLLLISVINFADAKPRDGFGNYLYALNMMSKLFSRLTENSDLITRRPERTSFQNLAIGFNKKVKVLIINQNNLIAIVSKSGFKDKRYPNALRVVQTNVGDLKKILTNNRQLVDNLQLPNFTATDVYDNLNISQYQNDEMIRLAQKNARNKAFKRKVVDNLTQSVVLLNECYSKVAGLYSNIK
ncbi:hypothetical protein [Mucilaginibacter antarcticus]|uniref:DUF4142 domain-containing protein n=1 Tax=Mucilaginibacter antarcticus TaxID=1855725 RepID=A0ABW5XPT5_9SPHI